MEVTKRTLLTLLLVLPVAALGEGTEAPIPAPAVQTVTPPKEVKMLMASRCQPCHFELRIQPTLLLNTGKWFRLTGDNFEVERRVFMEAPPHSMPMGALLDQNELQMLRNWFKTLHQQLPAQIATPAPVPPPG